MKIDIGYRNTVGIVDTLESLNIAHKLKVGAVNALEVRAEGFRGGLETLKVEVPLLARKFPLIITVRDASEGGRIMLNPVSRARIYGALLPYATLIDVEVAFLEQLIDVLIAAHERGVGVIASGHFFTYTPTLEELIQKMRLAQMFPQVVILKFAAKVLSTKDVDELVRIFTVETKLKLSVMGMGEELGKESRLRCAQLGSVLNYGFLFKPIVGGQWPAVELKQKIAELGI